MARSRLTTTSASQVQAILLPQPLFLVEMGFFHIDQAGLELPTSGDLPYLTSQSAGDYRHEPPHPTSTHFYVGVDNCFPRDFSFPLTSCTALNNSLKFKW